jgi:hypothetical protein
MTLNGETYEHDATPLSGRRVFGGGIHGDEEGL